jgi:hypothetical protein
VIPQSVYKPKSTNENLSGFHEVNTTFTKTSYPEFSFAYSQEHDYSTFVPGPGSYELTNKTISFNKYLISDLGRKEGSRLAKDLLHMARKPNFLQQGSIRPLPSLKQQNIVLVKRLGKKAKAEILLRGSMTYSPKNQW